MTEKEKFKKAREAPGTIPVICTAYDCPYTSCQNHVQRYIGWQDEGIFSALYSTCRKYISWIVDGLPMGDNGKNH